jgi:hypothetical protein
MRSSSCWRSGASPVAAQRAFEAAGHASLHGGALGERAQRQLQAHATRLFGAQRHDGTACLGQAFLGEVTNAVEDFRQRRIARTLVHGFFRRAELHEDAGEALRQAVVDLLADAIALGQHRGILGCHAELLETDAQRHLVRDGQRQFGAFGAERLALAEHEADAALARAVAEGQRQQVGALVALAGMPVGDARPQQLVERLERIEHRLLESLSTSTIRVSSGVAVSWKGGVPASPFSTNTKQRQ